MRRSACRRPWVSSQRTCSSSRPAGRRATGAHACDPLSARPCAPLPLGSCGRRCSREPWLPITHPAAASSRQVQPTPEQMAELFKKDEDAKMEEHEKEAIGLGSEGSCCPGPAGTLLRIRVVARFPACEECLASGHKPRACAQPRLPVMPGCVGSGRRFACSRARRGISPLARDGASEVRPAHVGLEEGGRRRHHGRVPRCKL